MASCNRPPTTRAIHWFVRSPYDRISRRKFERHATVHTGCCVRRYCQPVTYARPHAVGSPEGRRPSLQQAFRRLSGRPPTAAAPPDRSPRLLTDRAAAFQPGQSCCPDSEPTGGPPTSDASKSRGRGSKVGGSNNNGLPRNEEGEGTPSTTADAKLARTSRVLPHIAAVTATAPAAAAAA